MPIFITQGRYTREAVAGMIAKPEDRSKQVSKLMAAAGGRLIAHYLTFGQYDFAVIGEAPDAETMAAALIAVGGGGTVSDLTTTQAIPSADAKKIFQKAADLIGSFKPAGKG
jgi:uncharacterized protein with GYD domain